MLYLLQMLNYEVPKLEPTKINSLEIKKNIDPTFYSLELNGRKWMSYNLNTHLEAYELFSHYYLADGHCICTGLGFGIRENWLLKKKNVSKLTVLEKHKEVIDYHHYIKSPFLDHIELINCDASEYSGKCDTLLLDHYNGPDQFDNIINDVINITNNISHNLLWFWPLELMLFETLFLQRDAKLKKYSNFHDIYLDFKFNLKTLPVLSPEVLNMFVFMFKSDIMLDFFNTDNN